MSAKSWSGVVRIDMHRDDPFWSWDLIAIHDADGEVDDNPIALWERDNSNITIDEHKPLKRSQITYDGNLYRTIVFEPAIDIWYDGTSDYLYLNTDVEKHWEEREAIKAASLAAAIARPEENLRGLGRDIEESR